MLKSIPKAQERLFGSVHRVKTWGKFDDFMLEKRKRGGDLAASQGTA
jgi:hypothetical protein